MAGLFSHHGTLVASTVTTIDLQDNQASILITNRGATDIYARFDAVDPAVGADNTFIIQANTAKTFTLSGALITADRSVRLISSGTPSYSVEMG
jgi:hypothetical protein